GTARRGPDAGGVPEHDGTGPAGVGAALRPQAGGPAAPRPVSGTAGVGGPRPAGAAGVRGGVQAVPAAGGAEVDPGLRAPADVRVREGVRGHRGEILWPGLTKG